ncbi:MAG TPA: hypothetical protein VMV27_12145 [Candidatus Binataceae bacterium]|nr:hypothetical protein [Candidatus Binataceae bacterium]
MKFRFVPAAAVAAVLAMATLTALGPNALMPARAASETAMPSASPAIIAIGRPAALLSRGTIRFSELPPIATGAPRAIGSIARRVPGFAQSVQTLAAGQTGAGAGTQTLAAVEPSVAGGIGVSFSGIDEGKSDCDCEPPDTQVAAGPNAVVEAVNTAMNVFDKSGNLLLAKSLSSFYGVGADFLSDPRIRYDTQSGRWFISILSLDDSTVSGSHNSYLNLAISETSDPTGAFSLYQYETAGSLGDQPGLGISNDKIAISANAFSCSPNCGSGAFIGNEVLVIDKSDLVNADASPRADFYAPAVDQSGFTILPAHETAASGDALPDTLYMASVQYPSATSIGVMQVTGTPSGGTTQGTSISKASLAINRLDSPPQAPQLEATSAKQFIDSGDNRLLDAQWRDGALWVAADSACTPAGDTAQRACLRYIQILTGSMTVNQDFDFGGVDFYYYYPSIGLDSSDNLVSAFSGSSPTTSPSAYVSARLAGDRPNSLGAAIEIAPGLAFYGGTRWGDYSGAGVDPADQSTVWVGAEYAGLGSRVNNWSTEIASVRAPVSKTPAPPPGKLALSTRRVNFGAVGSGTTRTRRVRIRNADHGTLIVTAGNTLAAPFTSPQAGQTFTLGPHERATITIQFVATAPGVQSETLTITSNDPHRPTVTIAVRAKGRAPMPGRNPPAAERAAAPAAPSLPQ